LIKPHTASAHGTVAAPGETVMELFEAYARENPKSVKADTINQSRMAVELFAGTLPARFPASGINKKAVRDWKALLLQYPVKAAETTEFRGLSMRDIVQANAASKAPKPAISNRTVNRYLSGLGAFCDWLNANGYLALSPVADMFKRIDKSIRTTIPYTIDQLMVVFKSPLFTGCQSDGKMHLPGNHLIRDHRYWLPLVMLYSGARPAEIAQLLTDDVRELHGQWMMHVTREGSKEKSVKTRGSMRVIPIHPELLRLGFVRYCQAMRKRGERRLFPDAERNARGQLAAKFSREYGRFLTRIGLKQGRGLSLYSFRHGFIDALRRAGYLDDEFGFLVGHGKPSTTEQYGLMPQGMMPKRVAMVESVSYPGLDLAHLCASDA